MLTRRTLAAATVGLLTAMASSAAYAQTTLRSADIHPDGYPTVEAVQIFRPAARGAHQRPLQGQVFHSAQLGQEKDTIEQTRFGVIDLNRITMAPFNDLIPETLRPVAALHLPLGRPHAQGDGRPDRRPDL